jgi:Cys-tRNA(Pro)/Cys-tRNA(Cys) deacylase
MKTVNRTLAQWDCDYELITHPKPILTVQDGVDYFNIEAGQTAPTLILKTDRVFFALIFSGSRPQIDFAAVAILLGRQHVKLASPSEVEKETGFACGSVALVGHALPCILDRKLFAYPFVYGGSGNPLQTLKIAPASLAQINNVIAYLE